MVFYLYTIIYSKVVLNLSEFHSSAECKLYFEEQGKPNSFWSSVTSQIHQNTLFCVQHMKEMNTGLGQHESE